MARPNSSDDEEEERRRNLVDTTLARQRAIRKQPSAQHRQLVTPDISESELGSADRTAERGAFVLDFGALGDVSTWVPGIAVEAITLSGQAVVRFFLKKGVSVAADTAIFVLLVKDGKTAHVLDAAGRIAWHKRTKCGRRTWKKVFVLQEEPERVCQVCRRRLEKASSRVAPPEPPAPRPLRYKLGTPPARPEIYR